MSAVTETKRTRCRTSKVAFKSRGAAERALARIRVTEAQAAVPSVDTPCRSYRCGCGAWHLTHLTEKPARVRDDEAKRPPRRRRRRKPSKPAVRLVAAHLTPVPVVVAPPVLAVVDHTGPITPERRARWAEQRDELARLNLANQWPWRAAA